MKANKGDLQSERICIEKEMKRLGLENQFQRNIIVNCIISSTERMNKKSFFFFFSIIPNIDYITQNYHPAFWNNTKGNMSSHTW